MQVLLPRLWSGGVAEGCRVRAPPDPVTAGRQFDAPSERELSRRPEFAQDDRVVGDSGTDHLVAGRLQRPMQLAERGDIHQERAVGLPGTPCWLGFLHGSSLSACTVVCLHRRLLALRARVVLALRARVVLALPARAGQGT